MNPMTIRTLSALLLTLATLPALAGQADSTMFNPPSIKLAQLSPDERRALRERWEQATPEERIQLRKLFLERVRRMPSFPLPPEAHEAMQLPFPGRAPHEREQREDVRGGKAEAPDASFGFGFENRRQEIDRPEAPTRPERPARPELQRPERDGHR